MVHFTTKEIIACKGRAIAVFFPLSGVWEKGAFSDTKSICYKGRATAVFVFLTVSGGSGGEGTGAFYDKRNHRLQREGHRIFFLFLGFGKRVHSTTQNTSVIKGGIPPFFTCFGWWWWGGNGCILRQKKSSFVKGGPLTLLTLLTLLTYITYLTYLLGGFYKFIPSMGG